MARASLHPCLRSRRPFVPVVAVDFTAVAAVSPVAGLAEAHEVAPTVPGACAINPGCAARARAGTSIMVALPGDLQSRVRQWKERDWLLCYPNWPIIMAPVRFVNGLLGDISRCARGLGQCGVLGQQRGPGPNRSPMMLRVWGQLFGVVWGRRRRARRGILRKEGGLGRARLVRRGIRYGNAVKGKGGAVKTNCPLTPTPS